MKSIARIMLLLLTLMWTVGADASLQTTLNNMFVGNVTSAGAYNSATRSGFVGGDMYLRAPVKPINLAAFDAPRLNAGCGGMDAFGGSFSYINLQQFAALVRMIISNAAGLLFQTALAAINPSLASISEKFQKVMQDMNSTMANTCAIANQAIKAIHDPSAAMTSLSESTKAIGTDLGNLADSFANLANSPAAQNANGQQAEPFDPKSGNLTWKALARSQSQDMIGQIGQIIDPADPNEVQTKLFLISLIGTEVKTSYVMDASGNVISTSSCTPGPSSNCGSNPVSQATQYGPLFRVMDLVGESNISIYQCGGPVVSGDTTNTDKNSCLWLGNQQPLQFAGTRDYVRNMLYGDDTATTSAAIEAALAQYTASNPGINSIFGKLMACQSAGCNFTASEQTFLMMSGPLYKWTKESQFDKNTLPLLSSYIEDYLSFAIARSIGSAAIRAVHQAWAGVRDVSMPESVSNNIKVMSQDMDTLATIETQLQDNLLKAQKIADNVRSSLYVPTPHN